LKSEININGLRLLPEKAAFLDAEKMLIIADLHFGKINHFRQAGMPVPAAVNRHNEETLIDLINLTRPARVVFLGDNYKPGERTVAGTRSAEGWAYPQRYFAANADETLAELLTHVAGGHTLVSTSTQKSDRVRFFQGHGFVLPDTSRDFPV
jgi:metallophosphoesterase superfamily enzyme